MKTNRDCKYEFIRVIAMLFVISVHVIGRMSIDSKQRELFYHMGRLIFFTCNGLFYMLSGKFSLQKKFDSRECYNEYYKNRFVNLVVPIVFYMFLRYFYDCGWVINKAGFWRDFEGNVFSGYSSTEYWYLYALLGNVILAPFIGPVLQRLGKKEMQLFLLIGIIANSLATYASTFGYSWNWSYPLGGWSFYFYLGYGIDRIIETKIEKCVVVNIGIISYAISLIQIYIGKAPNICDLAPTFTFITCMVYILLKCIKIENNYIQKFIFFAGRHSFGVYMVHWVIMLKVMEYLPMQSELFFVYLAKIVIIIFMFSLIIGTIFDNTLLKLGKKLMSIALRIRRL